MTTLIFCVCIFIYFCKSWPWKQAKQHCLQSGKGTILRSHSFWMTFLCSAIPEITLGPLLVLFVQEELAQTWPSLPPTMTPHFPGHAPCWPCSVFQPLLAGVAVAQSYVASTMGHLFQTVVESSALGMLNGTGESSQQTVASLSFLLFVIHKVSVRRLGFVQICLFGLLLA